MQKFFDADFFFFFLRRSNNFSYGWISPGTLGSIFLAIAIVLTSFCFISVQYIPMDWQGQKLAEHLMQIMLLVFAAVAFATGYTIGSFRTMILVYAGGVVFTALVTVPNWRFFNRHPLKWLDPSEAEKHPKPQKPVNPNPKKKSTK